MNVVALVFVVLFAGLLLIPGIVLFVEVCAACFLSRSPQPARQGTVTPQVCVLIPAHNESTVIGDTLTGLMPNLRSGDQVIVVADNCSDETAKVASGFPGVVVAERFSETERGKGFALAFGLAEMQKLAPNTQIVVIVDADCRVGEHSIARIAEAADRMGRPAQAVYLMDSPSHATPLTRISSFAFLLKNLVRPLGLHHLRQPCLLTGTGMAFPRSLLTEGLLSTGNIVEDMQLGLDLAIRGYAPVLVPKAMVTGVFPESDAAARSQKTRWEHGHLSTLIGQVPRLLLAAVVQRRLNLVALALELSVPPVTLLILFQAIGVLAGLACLITVQENLFLVLTLVSASLTAMSILVAWICFGKHLISLSDMVRVPGYIISKTSIYRRFVAGRETRWVKTKRDGEA